MNNICAVFVIAMPLMAIIISVLFFLYTQPCTHREHSVLLILGLFGVLVVLSCIVTIGNAIWYTRNGHEH